MKDYVMGGSKMRKTVFGLLGIAVMAAAVPASAATVTTSFTFKDDSATAVASGSFSYDSSASGQLTFGDLLSFTVTLLQDAATYDLASVNALVEPKYMYFGYNTTSNDFTPADIPGGVGPYYGILAATDLYTGFFFDPLPSQAGPNSDGIFVNYPSGQYRYATTVEFSSQTSPVPLPASLPLILVGVGAFGAVSARRKMKKKAA